MIWKIVSDAYTRPGNTTAYTAGDAISDSASTPRCLTFAGAFPGPHGVVKIVAVRIRDSVVPTTAGQFNVLLFSGSSPLVDTGAAFDDNAALAVVDTYTDGTINKLVGYAPVTAGATSGLGYFYQYQFNPPLVVEATGTSADLYALLGAINAYQSSANDNVLTVELLLAPDN